MLLSPYGLLLLIVLFAAFLAPLIPLRRRAVGIAHFPIVTVSLLFANVIFYLASLQQGEPSLRVLQQWGLIPGQLGIFTLITHIFLHGSWDHLFGNMLGLWLFGPHVEEALGRSEYLLFYVGCGIAAGLLHLAFALTVVPSAIGTPLVGASGAIFGLLGLFAVRYWRTRIQVLLVFSVPAVWAVSFFALLQLIAGLISLSSPDGTGKVANWAHVGGFLFGALLAIPLKMREESAREYNKEDAEKAMAVGELEVAASHLRQALENAPEDAETQHALAKVYIQLRQAEAAHRHLLEALRFFLKGNQYVAVARVYQDALEGFEEFPLPARTLQRIASACEETEHYSLAIRALSDLCRDHPESREAEVSMLRLGKLHLHKMNQPQNAEGIFCEFLRLYPDSEWKTHAERLRDEARHSGNFTSPSPPSQAVFND
jgi:membrane associated rhomboid family serine protease